MVRDCALSEAECSKIDTLFDENFKPNTIKRNIVPSHNAVRNYMKKKNKKATKSVLGRPPKLSPTATRALVRFAVKGYYNARQVHDTTSVSVSVRTT